MVHKSDSKGFKYKPRGRPFTKGNVKGKPRSEIVGPSGRESSVSGGAIAPAIDLSKKEPLKQEIKDMKATTLETKEGESIDLEETTSNTQEHDNDENIDTIEFHQGQNVLKFVLRKKDNRMYRMQIFLNEDQEIRPVTYNGRNTAMAFWNLLKGSLKK